MSISELKKSSKNDVNRCDIQFGEKNEKVKVMRCYQASTAIAKPTENPKNSSFKEPA